MLVTMDARPDASGTTHSRSPAGWGGVGCGTCSGWTPCRLMPDCQCTARRCCWPLHGVSGWFACILHAVRDVAVLVHNQPIRPWDCETGAAAHARTGRQAVDGGVEHQLRRIDLPRSPRQHVHASHTWDHRTTPTTACSECSMHTAAPRWLVPARVTAIVQCGTTPCPRATTCKPVGCSKATMSSLGSVLSTTTRCSARSTLNHVTAASAGMRCRIATDINVVIMILSEMHDSGVQPLLALSSVLTASTHDWHVMSTANSVCRGQS